MMLYNSFYGSKVVVVTVVLGSVVLCVLTLVCVLFFFSSVIFDETSPGHQLESSISEVSSVIFISVS